VSDKDIAEIAKTKLPDLNCYDVEAAKTMIRGTARSIGLEVKD
jgi:large subunit ribosomal protein L11